MSGVAQSVRTAASLLVALAAASSVSAERKFRYGEEERIRVIDPVAEGELRLRPTFSSCGLCWGAEAEIPGLRFECREKGAREWRKLLEIPYFGEVRNYRGSILDLREGTTYDVRGVADGETRVSGRFTTWTSETPVARTVEIDPATVTFPVRISDKGGPRKWIRYVTKGGAPLVNDTTKPTFSFDRAKYVLVEGIRFRGPRAKAAVIVEGSRGVRIRNCEFSGWGCDVEPDFFREGLGISWPVDRTLFRGYDTAIRIGSGTETVVERCYFHDPRYSANSWIYSHPCGPNAIYMCSPDHSTVLRWNDFVGSDEIRWNDAVEGYGNFFENGGFNRDADVCGNFMIFSNDDCIELDGGNQNVRCFGNRFESAVSLVSVQGTMVSPTYVYDNLFVAGCAEQFGRTAVVLKTCGSDMRGKGSVLHFLRNRCFGPSRAIDVADAAETARFRVAGNRFDFGPALSGEEKAVRGRFADNATAAMDAALPYDETPKRPVPYLLSRGKVDGIRLAAGKLNVPSFGVRLVCGGKGYRQPFRIRQNDTCGWFAVTPSEGVVESGRTVDFRVTLDPLRMAGRRNRYGAFLVRTADGFSRPCTIYAETDFVPPFECGGPGDRTAYADLPRTMRPLATNAWVECAFDVPADGRYALLVHGSSTVDAPELGLSMDGGGEYVSRLFQATRHPTWSVVAKTEKTFRPRAEGIVLKKGRHVVRLRLKAHDYTCDGLVLTDNPLAFERY